MLGLLVLLSVLPELQGRRAAAGRLAPHLVATTAGRDAVSFERTARPRRGRRPAGGHGLGEAPTVELLAWIGSRGWSLTRGVVTHHHDDRLGGGAVLARQRIPFFGHASTRALAGALPPPESLGALEPGQAVRLGPVEVYFPGPAHAPDNVIVWVPEARVLFGGCAVRPASAQGMGNIADADLESWPKAIRRALARYPEIDVVVPGHGDPGDVGLLHHTLVLLETARRPPKP